MATLKSINRKRAVLYARVSSDGRQLVRNNGVLQGGLPIRNQVKRSPGLVDHRVVTVSSREMTA